MTLLTRLGALGNAARPPVLLLALAGSVALSAGPACVALPLGSFCTDNQDCLSEMCGPENACVVQTASVDGGACVMASDCPSGTLCDVKQGACFMPSSSTPTGGDGGTGGQSCATTATAATTATGTTIATGTTAGCPAGDYCTLDLICQPIPAALPIRAPCAAGAACPTNQICVTTDGFCAAALNASCATDADCPTGTICDAVNTRVCYRI